MTFTLSGDAAVTAFAGLLALQLFIVTLVVYRAVNESANEIKKWVEDEFVRKEVLKAAQEGMGD